MEAWAPFHGLIALSLVFPYSLRIGPFRSVRIRGGEATPLADPLRGLPPLVTPGEAHRLFSLDLLQTGLGGLFLGGPSTSVSSLKGDYSPSPTTPISRTSNSSPCREQFAPEWGLYPHHSLLKEPEGETSLAVDFLKGALLPKDRRALSSIPRKDLLTLLSIYHAKEPAEENADTPEPTPTSTIPEEKC
ncbi:hypothetical protein Salat_1663300 [Sesamum alatum]|uniref:Uncharacterized protein n=1 Tax=Sesamum alatum TaxID=300844 RepID=A0AAE2CJQ4_9LAMI|nr:hypothetical protein Salat_1663300 [Sesamum alatum]